MGCHVQAQRAELSTQKLFCKAKKHLNFRSISSGKIKIYSDFLSGKVSKFESHGGLFH